MSNADTPTPAPGSSAVTFDSKSETVVLPGGLVSVAGVTVVTGGLVILAISLGVMGSVAGYRYGRRKRVTDEGKVVLMGERGRSCLKTVTV
ncbi:hypothetical protein GN956_G21639 [Arapaima gigas]